MSNTLTVTAAREALYRLAAQLRNRRQANQQLSVQLEEFVLRNFQSEGALRGGWEPLKLSTIMARLRKGRSTPAKEKAKALYKQGRTREQVLSATGAGSFMILQDTGALRQSYAGFYDNDVAGVGTADSGHPEQPDIATMHEQGDPARNLPARPMLPDIDQALEMAMVVYEDHLEDSKRAAGLE